MYIYELYNETNILGFRPGLTQTGLCSHRRCLEARNFGFRKWRDCTIQEVKTKAQISFAVTAKKLICVFVFAYAKRWFSHNTAHIVFSMVQEKGWVCCQLIPTPGQFDPWGQNFSWCLDPLPWVSSPERYMYLIPRVPNFRTLEKVAVIYHP